MLNRLQNSIQLTWDQIYDVFVPKRPKLDAAQQTRLSWANRVKSYADVPEVFKDFFEPFQEADLDFPYTVRTPSSKDSYIPQPRSSFAIWYIASMSWKEKAAAMMCSAIPWRKSATSDFELSYWTLISKSVE